MSETIIATLNGRKYEHTEPIKIADKTTTGFKKSVNHFISMVAESEVADILTPFEYCVA
jgi:hypothetical protein